MVNMLWFVVLVASVGATREVNFKNCKTLSGTPACKVKTVEIDGCLSPSAWVDKDGSIIEYVKGNAKNPCRIDKGLVLNFSIAFEPGFSSPSLHSQISIPDLTNCYALQSAETSCPLWDPRRSGCLHTKCPLELGRQQWYDTTLQIPDNFTSHPVNFRKIYQLQWKLWSKRTKRNNCCFNIPVQY